MESTTLKISDVLGVFASMPIGQQILIGLFIATWVIGGNILVALHFRRVGKRWNPFSWPVKSFNSRERKVYLAIVLLTAAFGISAMFYSNG